MGLILSPIVHSLMFSQYKNGDRTDLRMVCFELMGNVVFPSPNTMSGNWVLHKADTHSSIATVLCRGITGSDRRRLIWQYDANQHGGLIEIGIDTPHEDHKNGKHMKFKNWFSLYNAKLIASGEFRAHAGLSLEGEGPAFYHPGGSSDTLDQGSGTWTVRRYNRAIHATTG